MTAIATLVISIVAFRFLPHPANIAPIGAFALIGGFHLGRRHALWVPFLATFLSDIALNLQAGYPAFHAPRIIDWVAFLLIGLAGLSLRDRGWIPKLTAVFVTPFFFFAVSNFGVWLAGLDIAGAPYPKTTAGLASCYAAGLPFLRGTLAGDWIFSAVFLSAAALVAAKSAAPARSLTIR
jgi:hypothetical protein